ncbi:MAG: CDP-alcohol phosphatidyltransferase family protein [Bacteroidetes bacterium]|nr:CDP-alcohol phosphatidyltransferase family protein [Bacteroidota bacterium]
MKINFKEINTKSNYISLLRLFLAVPLYFLLDHINDDFSYRIIIFGLMIFGLLTDLADGWIARKYNEITEFGKIIDPLADKIAIGVVVIKLYLIGEIPEFYFWVIILRDIIIFIGGIIISKIIGKVLPSNLLGKITVLTIGFFLIALTLNASEAAPGLYSFLYNLSLFMSFISVIGYGIRGYESIKWKKRNEAV